MNNTALTGIPKLVAATRYSWLGLRAAWRGEEAFRLELSLAIFMVPLAFYIGDGRAHQLVLVASCALVLLAELLNSAIEAVVDRIGPEQHELSGRAKDLGSAAVFVTLMLILLLWLPSIWDFYWRLSA